MTQLGVWLTRLIGTFGHRRCDRELASELDGHLHCHIDDNMRAGMTADEARRDAVLKLGVSQRTGEIGVRRALGAKPGTVAGMIVRQGGLVALAGIAVGLGTALTASRLIESLLYGIGPRDPLVFAATTLMLFAVALLACWLPARRAASVDPLVALRVQ